jgi:hypothetical protein
LRGLESKEKKRKIGEESIFGRNNESVRCVIEVLKEKKRKETMREN